MEFLMENVSSFPRLNEAAPALNAKTTHRHPPLPHSKTKSLPLSPPPPSPPPARPPGFMAFQNHADTFRSMNCELLGLSIDSLYSHLAWTQNIKEKFGVEISFPIIEDIKMDVAKAYGMVHPGAADTQAVRATFFIDPNGILRAMVYYPMSNGRSIDEFVRLLQAMQTSDANKVATPEGWTPGCDVIVPAPKTPDAIAKRQAEGLNTVDWYFTTKKL